MLVTYLIHIRHKAGPTDLVNDVMVAIMDTFYIAACGNRTKIPTNQVRDLSLRVLKNYFFIHHRSMQPVIDEITDHWNHFGISYM